MATLISTGASLGDGASELAAWMGSNYWDGWHLCDGVRQGVAVHHGRIPRALASRLVFEFNKGNFSVLVCTSTLIEGVNTAARSVFIYDKKINRSDYDFFTFSNIQGRAGRLGKHFVGRVFLFNEPPEADAVDVDTPLFRDLDSAPDELIVHVEPRHLGDGGSARIDQIAHEIGLGLDQLRRFSSLSVDVIRGFKRVIDQERKSLPIWSGRPRYKDLESVNKIICEVKHPFSDFGVATFRQLTFFMERLRSSENIKEFFQWYGEQTHKSGMPFDLVFKFIRACEYGLGEYYALTQTLVNSISTTPADYSLFIADMTNLFRPECVKVLDERGIPIQISERFYEPGDTIDTLSERLFIIATSRATTMTSFEQEWVLGTLEAGA